MSHKNAKRIRKAMRSKGIAIASEKYFINKKTGEIHADKGRKVYRKIKKIKTCLCVDPQNYRVADFCERCHRPIAPKGKGE